MSGPVISPMIMFELMRSIVLRPMSASVVHVAVGVVRNSQGNILIAKRPAHAHQGDLWEFPGGKVEKGESLQQALQRELHEELGIDITHARPLIRIPHSYPDKHVLLDAAEIEEYLNRVIVSRYNDFMGETIDSIVNLPSKYDELSEGLAKRLHEDFSHFGINLTHLYINSITPPPEVQQAIDDRSRMGVFDDMNKLMQMKAAMAMEKAAQAEGGTGTGMGTGMGLMMPAMFAQYFAGALPQSGKMENTSEFSCPECHHKIAVDAKFCPQCGHQQVVFNQCAKCGKNLTPNARFCPRCGAAVEEMTQTRLCPTCGNENLADSRYCNECGEKL